VTVSKEITRLEKSSVKLSVTIGKDDVRSEYDGLLSEYSAKIQMPGFRKGKVPKDVLVRKFGDSLKAEALSRITEKALEEVFSEDGLPRDSRPLPYSTPKIQDEPKLELENDLQFSVIYDVLPALKVEKWQELEVEIPDVAISDEDLARELDEIRERNSIVLDKDEGESAGKDDVVTVNYSELDDSGELVSGSEREDFTFTLGTERNIYKFDSEITGMKKGETREFTKSFGDDFEDKDIAGKTKKLKVTLTALKIKQLPELDDDLAQDVDEKYHTLDDLKNSIMERLNNDLKDRIKTMKINALLEKIMESTPVEIPDSMLNMELDSRWRNLARSLGMDAEGLNKAMAKSPGGAASILEGWKPEAAKALHSRLIVETLIEEQKFEASDEEADREIETIAHQNNVELDEARKYYENPQMKEYLHEQIKEVKLYDLMIEKNSFKIGEKKKYLDLIENNR